MENEVDEFRANSNATEEATDHVNLGSDSENVHISDDTEQTGGDTNRPIVLYGEPELGMTFDNDEDAYHFYCSYARSVGFKVRKRRLNQNRRGEIWKREYSCSCEGFYCKREVHRKKEKKEDLDARQCLRSDLTKVKRLISHGSVWELCQIAHRITSEGAKIWHSYTSVKSELLKLEEKLKSLQHTGQEHARRNGDSGSGNHTNEDGVHLKLQDPETQKSKGRGKGKMKNALGSKDSKKEASSERKGTHAHEMSGPSNLCENVQGSIGLGKEKELIRPSLCLAAQFPLGFPTVSGDQGIPYHLPGHQVILPVISNSSFTFAQEGIQPSIPRPQRPARQVRVSSSDPSRS